MQSRRLGGLGCLLLLMGLSGGCGRTAPKIPLVRLDFEQYQKLLASKRGKVVVVDAWSTSCAPCKASFPHLVELHRRFGLGGVACISLSFDYEGIGDIDQVERPVREFLEKQQATFDNVLASEASDVMYRKLNLNSVPAVFVYDQAGNLAEQFDNRNAKSSAEFYTPADVEHLVERLLANPPDSKQPSAN